MKPLIIIFSFLMLVSAKNCSGQKAGNSQMNGSTKEFTIEVNHYKVPCFTEGVAFCFLIKKAGENKWEPYADSINGFNYKWGYIYKLKVHRLEIGNPPADASSFKYVLDEVISEKKTDVKETFSFVLKYPGSKSFVYGTKTAGFSIIGQKVIECKSVEICDRLNNISGSDKTVEGTFCHSKNAGSVVLISLNFK
jgi:hypothetical protein